MMYKETTKYTTCRVALDSQRFPWRHAVQWSPLLQFTMSRGPRQLERCVAVLTGFSLTMFKEGDENISFEYRHMLRRNKNVFICWTSKIISHARQRKVTVTKNDALIFLLTVLRGLTCVHLTVTAKNNISLEKKPVLSSYQWQDMHFSRKRVRGSLIKSLINHKYTNYKYYNLFPFLWKTTLFSKIFTHPCV